MTGSTEDGQDSLGGMHNSIILTDKELKTLQHSITKMTTLEPRKRLNPKFSLALQNLAEVLDLNH